MKKNPFWLLCLFALLPSGLLAQTHWCVVDTNHPDVPLATVENVCFLMTSDYSPTLAVVCRDGQIVSGISSVAFRQLDATGIKTLSATEPDTPQLMSSPVAEQLCLIGCTEGATISVYDLNGHQLSTQKATAGQTNIAITHLPSGIYLLKTGQVTIKFIRK